MAAREPAAIVAHQHRRIAAAVDEYQALFAARQSFADRGQQRRRETVVEFHITRVDAGDARHSVVDAIRQTHQRIAAARGIVIGLQCRGGGAQHDRHATLARAHHREVARRVTKALVLFK